ncbi:KipI antagonist [Posidoniimonas polymericola]|uniref:KipI antagonist n=1 Tax=Posidoniimonas polymericola TaxID=2528002 RepID=A0A5C5YQJ1_9BACT|nr:KipI antagonist [Posidoniimonas polymericola]
MVQLDPDATDSRQRVTALADRLRANPLPGVTDVTQAFTALGIFFDPDAIPCGSGGRRHETVAAWVRSSLAMATQAAAVLPVVHTLPVCFDEAFAPDLPLVAQHAGCGVDEVVQLYCDADYRVGAVGFAPGFAYLEGLPQGLRVPRRARPRTRVPAGAVAIGGPYTAVYPNASPGGWNLIGRCPQKLFDPYADPPGLLQAGDRVRFEPIDRGQLAATEQGREERPLHREGRAVLRVASPGVQSSLQSLGRAGVRQWGVAAGGAMDTASLRLANELVGNAPDAVAIESTLVGPVVECLHDVVLGLAGGVTEALGGARRVRLRAGEQLDLRGLTGARAYVAAPGGFAAECVLGSADTDLQGGFGGHRGRALAAGDQLACLGELTDSGDPTGWFVPASPRAAATLRIVRHGGIGAVGDLAWRRLLGGEFRVASESNRMGVRLQGNPIPADTPGASESRPVAPGAVQIPPGGEPIILAADSQTLGGYPVAGCVAAVDLPILAQLRPAESLTFREVSLADAERLYDQVERELQAVHAGVREAIRRA